MGSSRNNSNRNRRRYSQELDRSAKGSNLTRKPSAGGSNHARRNEPPRGRAAEPRNDTRRNSNQNQNRKNAAVKNLSEGSHRSDRSHPTETRNVERWGHSGYKELYENGGSRSRRSRTRSRSPVRRSRSLSRNRLTSLKQTGHQRSGRSAQGRRSPDPRRISRSRSGSNRQSQRDKPSVEPRSQMDRRSPVNKSSKSVSSSRSRSRSSSLSRSSSSSSEYSSNSRPSRRSSSQSSSSESEEEEDERSADKQREAIEDEEEGEMKDESPKPGSSKSRMTLSERFGKLAQFSSQRRNFEMVQLRIVAPVGEAGKNVSIDERSPAPLIGKKPQLPLKPESPPPSLAQWKDFQVEAWQEFHDYQQQRDLPPDWEDIRVRHKYYVDRGHFARDMSLEELARWEDWWRRYQQWRKGYERAWHSMHGRHIPVEYPDWNNYRSAAAKEAPLPLPQPGSVRSRLGWRPTDNNTALRRKKF